MATVIIAQPKPFGTDRDLPYTNPKPIYLETHLIQDKQDSTFLCFVSYKVSFPNVVFVKDNGHYSGGITLNVEAVAKDGSVVRGSATDIISVQNYSDTDDRNQFLEGILSFELRKGRYELNPLVNILNTDRHIPLSPIRINAGDSSASKLYIVEQVSKNCDEDARYKLVNFENSIPYAVPGVRILIPVPNNKSDNVKIKLYQKEELIREETLSTIILDGFILEKCNNDIIISENSSKGELPFFIFEDASKGLNEGYVNLNLFEGDSLLSEYELNVIWPQKPRTLFDPKFAFELLEIVEDEDTLDKILENNDDEYLQALEEFWEGKNPGGNSSYNALKTEFYTRADYALKEFATPNKRNGIYSDRGRIYIKYGEPSDIERVYSDKNQITEIWKYEQLNLEFVFVDKTGFGNYRLQQ